MNTHNNLKPQFQQYLDSQKRNITLNLNDQFLSEESIKNNLLPFLSNNTHFKKIELKGNNISPSTFSEICNILQDNLNLEIMILEWNRIGLEETGILALKNLLERNRNLKYIDLKNNKLGVNEVLILSNILRKNTSILWLDLSWNNIGNIGMKHFISSLQENKTLLYLDYIGNNISEELAFECQKLLDRNRNFNKITKNSILTIKKEKNISEIKNIKTEDSNKNENIHFIPEIKEQEIYLNKLEKNIEKERNQSNEIRKKLEIEQKKLKEKESEDIKQIEELESNIKNLILKNEKTRSDLKKIRLDMESIQKSNIESLKFYEERLKTQTILIKRDENEQKAKLERISNENTLNYKIINNEWEERIRLLESRLKEIHEINLEMENQITKIDHNIILKNNINEQEINQLNSQGKQYELEIYNLKLTNLKNSIDSLSNFKQSIINRNNQLAQKIQNNEQKSSQEMFYADEEYNRIRNEYEIFNARFNEVSILKDKMKNDLKIKKNQLGNSKEELKNLFEKLEKKKYDNKIEINNLKINNENEIKEWNKNKELKMKKINELEIIFHQSCNENISLKSDYTKLIQLLQKDLSQTLYGTFSANKFI